MTSISGSATATRVSQTSVLQQLDGTGPARHATFNLDVAAGADALTFIGSGSIIVYSTAPGGGGNSYPLSAAQLSLPSRIPLDQMVGEWRTFGTQGSLRLIVGSIAGLPDWMRVCWRIEYPGVLRLACTRHRIADGAIVGADAVHDVDGDVFTHLSNEEAGAPRRVLACVRTDMDRGVVLNTQRYSQVFEFRYPSLRVNWAPSTDFSPTPAGSPLQSSIEQLAGGVTRYVYSTLRSVTSVEVRNNGVERYTSGGGFMGSSSQVNCE